MIVRKEVIRSGPQVYVDKTGQSRLLNATPDLIKYWHDTGNQMRAAGLTIPVPYEHDLSATPMTPADLLRNNAGEVQNFEIADVTEKGADGKDVTVKGVLFSNTDIKDTHAVEKIKNGSVRWTSPWFTSFTDGGGKKWEGVIGHLALTSRPRITNQQPFQAAFSLSPIDILPTQVTPEGFCLSRAGMVCESHPGVFKPLYPVAFSLWTGAAFAFPDEGGEEKKDKKKEKPKNGEKGENKDGGGKKSEGDGEDGEKGGNPFGKDGEEGGGKGQGKFDPMTGEPIKTALVDPDGDVSVWTVVADMLSGLLGIEIGEDVTSENGLEKLYEVLREAMKQKMSEAGAADVPDPTATTPPPPVSPPGGGGSKNPIIQEQQPMYMSLDQANAIADPTMKHIALSLVHAQADAAKEKKRSDGLQQKLFNDAKAAREKRMARLTKTLPPDQVAQLNALAGGAQFSLGDDGVVADPIDPWLTLLEKQMAMLPTLLKTDSSQWSIQPHPAETAGAISNERIKQVQEEFERNARVA